MDEIPIEIIISHIVPYVSKYRVHLFRAVNRTLREALPIRVFNLTVEKVGDSRCVSLLSRSTRVIIRDPKVLEPVVAALSVKNRISSLDIRHYIGHDEKYREFANLLRDSKDLVSVAGRDFDPADLPAHLQEARISHYTGTDKIARSLVSLLSNPKCNLTRLDLRSSTFSASQATEILNCGPNLTYLNLAGYTGLGAADLGRDDVRPFFSALKQHKALKYLDISYQQLQSDAANEIAELLRVNQTLTSLDLSGNGALKDSESIIWQCLEKNTSLQELVFEDCGLSDLDALNKCFSHNTTLTSACVIPGNIHPWTPLLASIFAPGRKPIRILTSGSRTLDLGVDIAETLNQRTHWLTELHFESWSTIDAEKARHLRSFLIKAQNLQTLTIAVPKLEMDLLTTICEGLSKNTTLRSLVLGEDFAEEETLQCIGDALEDSSTIEIIKIVDNEGLAPIVEELRQEFPSIVWKVIEYIH